MVKLKSMFIIILIYCSCNEKEITLISSNKVRIVPSVSHIVDSLLSKQDCYAIEVTNDGYCRTTDASVATHYFHNNSITLSFRDTSEVYSVYFPFFAYAYKKNDSLNIILQQDNRIFHILKSRNNTFSIDYFLLYPKRDTIKKGKSLIDESIHLLEGTVKVTTHKSELILDKNSYSVGDTIRGYIFYQGFLNGDWEKDMISFRCVVGKSSDPLDYVATYPRCEGIVNEIGLGKSRNIMAPPLKDKPQQKSKASKN